MDKQDFIQWAEKLQDGYVLSDSTREHLSTVDLVAIVGPTGVGKTSIMRKLDVPMVIGDVTREQREGEKNGKDYLFRTDYLDIVTEIKAGVYVQFVISRSGEFYGTRSYSYPDEGSCTMAIVASVIPMFKQLGFRSVKQFYIMPPSYKEWMRRLSEQSRSDLLNRIDEARQSVSSAANNPDEYTFILNDDIDQAAKDIQTALDGNEIDPHRLQLAQDTANIILEYIGDDMDLAL